MSSAACVGAALRGSGGVQCLEAAYCLAALGSDADRLAAVGAFAKGRSSYTHRDLMEAPHSRL